MEPMTQKLAMALEKVGVTRSELARRLEMTPQAVGQWFMPKTNGGRTPSEEKLEQIEEVLQLPPGFLSGRDGSVPRKVRLDTLSDHMQGVEIAYLAVAMEALRSARAGLLRKPPSDAVREAAGKEDTHMFDAITEQIIMHKLRKFNDRSIIFTEESPSNVRGQRDHADRTCYFVDPFDRSVPFARALETSRHKYIAELMQDKSYRLRGLAAPFGSITCVREGQIAFNAMIDYTSGEIYVACKAMKKHANADDAPDPETLAKRGKDIRFAPRDGTGFTCFVGAPGSDKRPLYERNLRGLFGYGQEKEASIKLPAKHLQVPGGPARVLYLSDDPELVPDPKVAYILSNGEKITEWLGWLAYAIHSDQLAVYELHAMDFFARDKILLAPPPNYSIFSVESTGSVLNLDQLLILHKPAFYRGAVIVTHVRNMDVIAELRARETCRELTFSR